jgi:hydroxymethylglutaryl-CoA synthase
MNETTAIGIGGLAIHVPRARVDLRAWCEWTGQVPDKVLAVVGRSFRVPTRNESVYTMAATAALRLIEQYDLDPREIGHLALGTESSTDNAIGAVIVKGMLDRALLELGRPATSRACEVPEVKHACLGGMYAVKGAARWAALEGRGRKAIVVAADIAEYERGSTGEPTQGAGAVAMLVERNPGLFAIDLPHCGSAAAYRGVDFRKPFARHFTEGYAAATRRLHDFPVFNGKYSTTCYVDAVIAALDDMFARTGWNRRTFWDEVAAAMLHRPYHHMPIQAMAAAIAVGMAREPEDREAFVGLCREAGVDPEVALAEASASDDLFDRAQRDGVDVEPTPELQRAIKGFRAGAWYKKFVAGKMSLGADGAMELGNLYTASLPAWWVSAFAHAHRDHIDLAGRTLLAIGYGSGDAAEAWPLRVVPHWRDAAARIGFADALADAVDLDRASYEALHDGHDVELDAEPRHGFVVDRVGACLSGTGQDVGIEYYRFVR